MKKLFTFLVMCCISFVFVFGNEQIFLTDDNYVIDIQPDDVLQTELDIVISAETGKDDVIRRGYENFNFSSVTGTMSDFSFTHILFEEPSAQTGRTLEFYFCNDTFNPSALTWNNQNTEVTECYSTPFYTQNIATITGILGTPYTITGFNLNDYINADSDKQFAIKIKFNPEGEGSLDSVRFCSQEYGSSYKAYFNFTSSSTIYQQNSSNIYVYEDFNNFNVTRWFNHTEGTQENVWTVTDGQLIHNVAYENTTGLIDAIYLIDPDFVINPKDEWTVKVNITTGSSDPQQRLWVSINSNYTAQPFDYNLEQEYWYVMLSSSDEAELHSMQGIGLHERYNILTYSGHLTNSMQEITYNKRNIPENDTWYVEISVDGTPIYNDSSIYHGTEGACGTEPFCPRTVNNFTYSDFYFAFGGFSATHHSDWYMDDFELFVSKYVCVSDWQCTAYVCNATSGVKSCTTVNDNNNCSVSYSGDYSEFVDTCPITEGGFESGSTNFSAIENYSDVPDLILIKNGSTIAWENNVNIEGTNLVTTIGLGNGFASVDSANLDSSLNSIANVSISTAGTDAVCSAFKIYYANGYYTSLGQIKRYGRIVATEANVNSDCIDSSVCKKVKCINGVVKFEAQHFDGFGIGSNLPAREGCQSTQLVVYAGLSLLAVAMIAIVGFGITKIVGGDVGVAAITALAFTILGLAIVIMLGYVIISTTGIAIC